MFMPGKQFKRLPVRQMPFIAAYAPFQMNGVATIFQHTLIVIGFQESYMAFAEIADYVAARAANICKYADSYPIVAYQKTMWIYRIMQLWEREYR